MKKLMLVLAVLLTVAGCQSNPITGRKQLMLVSEDSAIASSKEAYAAMLQPLAKAGEIDSNQAVVISRTRIPVSLTSAPSLASSAFA